MDKTFQYQQQIFAGLELEIYSDLLKQDKIFLQCTLSALISLDYHWSAMLLTAWSALL